MIWKKNGYLHMLYNSVIIDQTNKNMKRDCDFSKQKRRTYEDHISTWTCLGFQGIT